MIRGVLFDFDGVIVQSEELHRSTFMVVLAPFNINVQTERWYREFAGTGSRHIITSLLKENKIQANIDELVEKRKKLYESRVKNGELRETDGIRSFLSFLKEKNIKTAIVSGSHSTNVAAALSFFGLRHFFDVIVSGDDLPMRKPDPGPFLHAAKLLGLKPEECLAVEDSVAGAKSAKAAGMLLVVVKSPASAAIDDYALIIDDFREIEKLRLLLGS